MTYLLAIRSSRNDYAVVQKYTDYKKAVAAYAQHRTHMQLGGEVILSEIILDRSLEVK